MSAAILAYGAVSALGEGRAAVSAGEAGGRARVAIQADAELTAASLARPFAARVPLAGDPGAGEERATRILSRALDACAKELDGVRPGWRRERVGLVLGTSSGGMRQAERFFDGEAVDGESATYFGPSSAAARELGVLLEPYCVVLGACASSTIALGLAAAWLGDGACDVCLAGGYDAVSVFVAAGFEVLRATSARVPPAPFRVGRDGMALGEGAAIVALARKATRARGYVAGFGASADAVHLTAPDRTGSGLARAIARATGGAAALPAFTPSAFDIVSAHATATPFNDPAEARALALTVERGAVVQPFKAQIGHTLGAAGALEALSCIDAFERGVLPAAAGEGEIDDDARVRLLDVAERGAPSRALKLSAAFGGANAALVLTKDEPLAAATPAKPAASVFVSRPFHVADEPDLDALATRLGTAPDRLARADGLVRLALASVADLAAACGSLAGAGVVVGHAFATLETNALFHAKIREKGARNAEPRRFPYTSPNAVCGECSLAFGLTGPSFAVGGGLHGAVEALAVASLLVRSGASARVVVVAVDDVGGAVQRLASLFPFPCAPRSGAVAFLVSNDRAFAASRLASARVRFDPARDEGPFGPVGHRALLSDGAEIASRSPNVSASVTLEPL